MTVSAPLAGVLAARRATYNRRVAEARHRLPGLDTAAFAAFVRDAVDPLCVVVDRVDSRATADVADVAFDLALDLVGQGFAGPKARMPWVGRAWTEVAPAAAALVAQSPLPTLAALTNAAAKLGGTPGVRVDAWLAPMRALAPHCESVARLRDLGALCAWHAGMAQLRDAALAAADRLPPTLAAAVFGTSANGWATLRAALHADRWWDPARGGIDPQGRVVGGFAGFGGAFSAPPQVRVGADGFIVRSGERHHLVIADAFGAVVLPAGAAEFAQARDDASDTAPPGVQLGAHGVRVHGDDIAFAAPVDGLRATGSGDSVALSSPWTHWLRVVPLRR